MTAHDWHVIVEFGSYGRSRTNPPLRTAWHGREEAEAALSRWSWREGAEAGSHIAACRTQVVGPFCSRSIALNADISDWWDDVCRCDVKEVQ